MYVLAEQDMQEKVWKQIYQSVDNGLLPHEISSEIYLSLYRAYCQEENGEEKIKEKVEDFLSHPYSLLLPEGAAYALSG
ncbi:hypothetical protein GCM10020331_050770 [Ectobacillus funiculus]